MLLLELARPAILRVGRLGPLTFPTGFYAYIGSARGSGGLAARLRHHLGRARRRHWHIDYLRRRAPVIAAWGGWGEPLGLLGECALAARLAAEPVLRRPFKGFGSSDCRCPGHLLLWTPADAGAQPPALHAHRTEIISRMNGLLAPLSRLL